eukprot:m.34795 g.34795  ORF g.34795 m.34795 type:complete len:537 (-) comp8776_c0_seq1:34-1644(-)
MELPTQKSTCAETDVDNGYIQVGPYPTQTENVLETTAINADKDKEEITTVIETSVNVTEKIGAGERVVVTEGEKEESTLKLDVDKLEEPKRRCTKKSIIISICVLHVFVAIVLMIVFLRHSPSKTPIGCGWRTPPPPEPHVPTLCYEYQLNPPHVPLQNVSCHNNNDCQNLNCSSHNNYGNVYSGACFCKVPQEKTTISIVSTSTTRTSITNSTTTTTTSSPSPGSCACMEESRAVCGRPYRVAGEPRLAPHTTAIDDTWLYECDSNALEHTSSHSSNINSSSPSNPPSQSLSLSSHQRKAVVGKRWLQAAAMEHASIASFARHTLELLSLGTPATLIVKSQEASLDEIRHTQICYAMARDYLQQSFSPGEFDVADEGHTYDVEAIVKSVVQEGCVGEMYGAVYALVGARLSVNKTVSRLLETIGNDETKHAQLAWELLLWMQSNNKFNNNNIGDIVLKETENTIKLRRITPTITQDYDITAHGFLSTKDEQTIDHIVINAIRLAANTLIYGLELPKLVDIVEDVVEEAEQLLVIR